MDKYEYLTGEDLGYKPGVAEKVNIEYSPLGEAWNNKAKSKTVKRNKIVDTNELDKNLFYISQHSFVKFKDISDLNIRSEFSLDSMHKELKDFHKKFARLKELIP